MYCVKCGVKLADTESVCPLCGTRVYHPDIVRNEAEPTYPVNSDKPIKIGFRGIMFAITVAFAAVIAQLVVCLFSIPSSGTWVGYAMGGVMLLYIIVFLPLWFKKPNPVIFVPCDYAALLLYLLYIDLTVRGGWFLSFAFPVVGANALIVTAIVVLCHYLRRGYLYIFGGALIAHGGFMVLLEFLIGLTFLNDTTLRWSYFPLVGCIMLGIALIVIAISPALKESLKKKLFF
ncbi:MAG: zinc ribbon domain-containing protein [Clostridia bacterium]|nr:zinc ribbon domain-containing protein [Clostridia bacterium]